MDHTLTPDREVLVVGREVIRKRTIAASEYAYRRGRGSYTSYMENGPLCLLTYCNWRRRLLIMTNKGYHQIPCRRRLKLAVAQFGVRMMRPDQDAIVSSLAIVDREDETEEASKYQLRFTFR